MRHHHWIFFDPCFILVGTIDSLNLHCVKSVFSELFWSAFSRIRTEYGKMQGISPYSVWMQENADQNNSEYGHFWRTA